MDIPESVTTASAAAAVASRLMTTAARTWAPKPKPVLSRVAEFPPRIGVFLCHCGTNIAKTIDLAKLATAVARLPGVAHVEDNLFSCCGGFHHPDAGDHPGPGAQPGGGGRLQSPDPRRGLPGGFGRRRPEPGLLCLCQYPGAVRLGPSDGAGGGPDQGPGPGGHGGLPGRGPDAHPAPELSGDSPGPGAGGRRGRAERRPDPGGPGLSHLSGGTGESLWAAWPGSCTLPWKARTPRNFSTNSRPRSTSHPNIEVHDPDRTD